jgi:hypothetical protein
MLHTPGPWKVIPSPHGPKYACVQYGADDSYTSLEMLPADAQLTAAAPALLEALLHVRTDLLRTDFKNYAARAAYMERYIKAALKTVGA